MDAKQDIRMAGILLSILQHRGLFACLETLEVVLAEALAAEKPGAYADLLQLAGEEVLGLKDTLQWSLDDANSLSLVAHGLERGGQE